MAPAAEGLHLFGKRRAVTMALSREEILGGSRIWEETSSDLVILAKTKAATSPFLFQAWRSSGLVGSGLRQPLASSPVLARRMWSLPLARPPKMAWNCYFTSNLLWLWSSASDVTTEGMLCPTGGLAHTGAEFLLTEKRVHQKNLLDPGHCHWDRSVFWDVSPPWKARGTL